MFWSKKKEETKQQTVPTVNTDNVEVGDVVCWYDGDDLKHTVVGHIYEFGEDRRFFTADMGFSLGKLQIVLHVKPKTASKKVVTKKTVSKKIAPKK